jgi:hypothetical protein
MDSFETEISSKLNEFERYLNNNSSGDTTNIDQQLQNELIQRDLQDLYQLYNYYLNFNKLNNNNNNDNDHDNKAKFIRYLITRRLNNFEHQLKPKSQFYTNSLLFKSVSTTNNSINCLSLLKDYQDFECLTKNSIINSDRRLRISNIKLEPQLCDNKYLIVFYQFEKESVEIENENETINKQIPPRPPTTVRKSFKRVPTLTFRRSTSADHGNYTATTKNNTKHSNLDINYSKNDSPLKKVTSMNCLLINQIEYQTPKFNKSYQHQHHRNHHQYSLNKRVFNLDSKCNHLVTVVYQLVQNFDGVDYRQPVKYSKIDLNQNNIDEKYNHLYETIDILFDSLVDKDEQKKDNNELSNLANNDGVLRRFKRSLSTNRIRIRSSSRGNSLNETTTTTTTNTNNEITCDNNKSIFNGDVSFVKNKSVKDYIELNTFSLNNIGIFDSKRPLFIDVDNEDDENNSRFDYWFKTWSPMIELSPTNQITYKTESLSSKYLEIFYIHLDSIDVQNDNNQHLSMKDKQNRNFRSKLPKHSMPTPAITPVSTLDSLYYLQVDIDEKLKNGIEFIKDNETNKQTYQTSLFTKNQNINDICCVGVTLDHFLDRIEFNSKHGYSKPLLLNIKLFCLENDYKNPSLIATGTLEYSLNREDDSSLIQQSTKLTLLMKNEKQSSSQNIEIIRLNLHFNEKQFKKMIKFEPNIHNLIYFNQIINDESIGSYEINENTILSKINISQLIVSTKMYLDNNKSSRKEAEHINYWSEGVEELLIIRRFIRIIYFILSLPAKAKQNVKFKDYSISSIDETCLLLGYINNALLRSITKLENWSINNKKYFKDEDDKNQVDNDPFGILLKKLFNNEKASRPINLRVIINGLIRLVKQSFTSEFISFFLNLDNIKQIQGFIYIKLILIFFQIKGSNHFMRSYSLNAFIKFIAILSEFSIISNYELKYELNNMFTKLFPLSASVEIEVETAPSPIILLVENLNYTNFGVFVDALKAVFSSYEIATIICDYFIHHIINSNDRKMCLKAIDKIIINGFIESSLFIDNYQFRDKIIEYLIKKFNKLFEATTTPTPFIKTNEQMDKSLEINSFRHLRIKLLRVFFCKNLTVSRKNLNSLIEISLSSSIESLINISNNDNKRSKQYLSDSFLILVDSLEILMNTFTMSSGGETFAKINDNQKICNNLNYNNLYDCFTILSRFLNDQYESSFKWLKNTKNIHDRIDFIIQKFIKFIQKHLLCYLIFTSTNESNYSSGKIELFVQMSEFVGLDLHVKFLKKKRCFQY